MLAEARKYGISLCTAFQGFYQVPFTDDILTNAATQIVFNCSGEDAEVMARNWNDPDTIPAHLTGQNRYEFVARTFEDDQPIVRKIKAPSHLQLRFKNETTKRATFDKVVNASLERWGQKKPYLRQNCQSFDILILVHLLGGSIFNVETISRPKSESG